MPAPTRRLWLRPIMLSIASLLLLATSPSVLADLRLDGGDDLGWDTDEWRSQVDGVMGGKSSGSLTFESSDTVMFFSGDVVLDGGGFSSVRKERFDAVDLTPYAGIVVELETTRAHDGDDVRPPLGLHLQFHDTVSYFAYASAFAVPLASSVGQETSVYLPLSSFDRGSRMGFQCRGCQIDFSSVNEMDIYVLFQKGQFKVRIKAVTAVDSPVSFPTPVIDIDSTNEMKALIESTIQSGGGLYDYGYMELCIAIYMSTLNSLLGAGSDNGDSSAVSNAIKGMICQGLQRADSQSSKNDIAWTLRHTMDSVLEELGFSDPYQGNGWRPSAATNETSAIECSAVTSEGSYPSGQNQDLSSPDNFAINEVAPASAPMIVSSSTPSLPRAGVVALFTISVLLLLGF